MTSSLVKTTLVISVLLAFFLVLSTLIGTWQTPWILHKAAEETHELEIDSGSSIELYCGKCNIIVQPRENSSMLLVRKQVYSLFVNPEDLKFRITTDLSVVKIEIEEPDGLRFLSFLLYHVKLIVEVPKDIENLMLVAKTVNGNTELRLSSGIKEAEVFSVNGNIEIRGMVEKVKAVTTNGNVKVITYKSSSLEVKTTNGEVKATIIPVKGGAYLLSATNGNIKVQLPENVSLEITLSTVNGVVKVENNVSRLRRVNGNMVVGELGEGGATLEASTTNGNVIVEFLKE